MKFPSFLFLYFFAAFCSASSHAQEKVADCDQMYDTLDAILFKQMPEIESFGPYIEGLSKGDTHAMTMIRSCPNAGSKDSIERDYYELYIGEDHPTHTVRIYGIFIHKDLKKILVYSPAKDIYMPLEKIRQTKKWKRDWEIRKRWVETHYK